METQAAPAPCATSGRYRWVVVWLLFAAMVINYVGRQTLGLLKADLSVQFGWHEKHYADLVFYFPGYSYLGFFRKAKSAGCAGYMVSLSGRRAVYFGRDPALHTGPFP